MSDYSKKCNYNKLVRDGVLDHLDSKGIPYGAHIAREEEMLELLLAKLEEEVTEIKEKPSIKELADALESIYGLADHLKIDRAELEKYRLELLKERGGFTKRIFLEWS